MKKGVSINTLIMLAATIIIMLAAVAWFMGTFGPTAQEQSLKQRFDASCITWTTGNCAEEPAPDADQIPDKVCDAYNRLMSSSGNCDHTTVAQACGCIEPYGIERP